MMMSFWDSPDWHEYEAACGDVPGTRAATLAGATWSTRVVGLNRDRDLLWRDLRKSYRPLASAVCPPVYIVAYVDGDQFLRHCQTIHVIEAGRQTRPAESWRLQAEWLDSQKAACVMVSRPTGNPLVAEHVAFAYAVIHGEWAYYFSGASLAPNVSHGAQWHLMVQLRRMGVRLYELGWQGHASDVKGRNIEFFKTGFGGVDVPLGPARVLALARARSLEAGSGGSLNSGDSRQEEEK